MMYETSNKRYLLTRIKSYRELRKPYMIKKNRKKRQPSIINHRILI